MKRALGIALSLALRAGCARETRERRHKTAGNLVPWTKLAAGAILVVPVAIAAVCNYQA